MTFWTCRLLTPAAWFNANIMNVSIRSVKIKGYRAIADFWTPVAYFYEINRIGPSIRRHIFTLQLAGFKYNSMSA